MKSIHRFDELFKLVKDFKKEEFRNRFLKLHERDQADFFDELYPDKKIKIEDLLYPEEFAEIFEYLSNNSKCESLKTFSKPYLEKSFNEMPDDVLANFVSSLEESERENVFAIMKPETSELVKGLLDTKLETAASVMTTQFISVSVDDTSDDVIKQMRKHGRQNEMIYYIYCVDDKKQLCGVVSLKDLILSPGKSVIKEIMNNQPVFVYNQTDQEAVAKLIADYDLLAIPVVNSKKVLIGIVTVDDVIDILEEEATEDFHKFSAIVKYDEREEEVETVFTMTKKRLPWIIILIFLGLISANLINYFEETLAQVVALVAFMPIMLDSAGNVGTQSLAVSVRKLALDDNDENILKGLVKELLTGVLIGITSGIVISILAYIMYGNTTLGIVVGSSLAITLSLSTVIGYSVPNIFYTMGIDPAVASGPFITTICDVFALILNFGMATYFIHLF